MNVTDLGEHLRLRRLHNGSWRGACPACGYADTFSLRERDGRTLWSCASCQDRDALCDAVRDAAGGGWTPPRPAAPIPAGLSPARRTALAVALWAEAVAVAGTPAETYLRARGVLDAWQAHTMPKEGPQLRFHRRIKHPEADGMHPAMLALIRRATDGEPVAIHRTYLRRDGSGKADLTPDKASFGPVAGGAIMLHAGPVTGPLLLAEGIETALSASALMGAPGWAAVSAGNLERLPLPDSVRDLIIAADADAPGQRAAWGAARRWQAEDRRVRVAIPDTAGRDFNDIQRARGASTGEAISHG